MKIASVVFTFVLLACFGIGMFFGLILALNGFSERDAGPALIFYIAWLAFFTMVFSAGSFFLTKLLLKKSYNAILALLISICVNIGAGLIVDFLGLIAGAVLASEIRKSH